MESVRSAPRPVAEMNAGVLMSGDDEPARLAMALLLLASLEAVGGAALLPLAYDSLLAAAAAMVLPGAAAGLVLRG